MATVRIYKVAELLGTTSQEVTALLKRDHGIDLKSASSTIEEVVARQFVERLARQRNISLPGGDIFADTPAVKGKKGGTPAKKAGKKLVIGFQYRYHPNTEFLVREREAGTFGDVKFVKCLALRCCVAICTTRPCVRAASTITRPSPIVSASGFST